MLIFKDCCKGCFSFYSSDFFFTYFWHFQTWRRENRNVWMAVKPSTAMWISASLPGHIEQRKARSQKLSLCLSWPELCMYVLSCLPISTYLLHTDSFRDIRRHLPDRIITKNNFPSKRAWLKIQLRFDQNWRTSFWRKIFST